MDGSNFGTVRDGGSRLPPPCWWAHRVPATTGLLVMLGIAAATLAVLVTLQPTIPSIEGL